MFIVKLRDAHDTFLLKDENIKINNGVQRIVTRCTYDREQVIAFATIVRSENPQDAPSGYENMRLSSKECIKLEFDTKVVI